MGNLIKEMKAKIAASGSSKKELLYFGKDSVKRVRFLQELDTGFTFQFHNDWNAGILELCKDPEDHENCKLCEQGIKIYKLWSVSMPPMPVPMIVPMRSRSSSSRLILESSRANLAAATEN